MAHCRAAKARWIRSRRFYYAYAWASPARGGGQAGWPKNSLPKGVVAGAWAALKISLSIRKKKTDVRCASLEGTGRRNRLATQTKRNHDESPQEPDHQSDLGVLERDTRRIQQGEGGQAACRNVLT